MTISIRFYTSPFSHFSQIGTSPCFQGSSSPVIYKGGCRFPLQFAQLDAVYEEHLVTLYSFPFHSVKGLKKYVGLLVGKGRDVWAMASLF